MYYIYIFRELAWILNAIEKGWLELDLIPTEDTWINSGENTLLADAESNMAARIAQGIAPENIKIVPQGQE